MTQYIARRVISLIPVLLGVSIIVFSLIRMIPGDPVTVMLGERAHGWRTSSARARWVLTVRSTSSILSGWDALRGDLGTSIINRTPVMDELRSRLAATLNWWWLL